MKLTVPETEPLSGRYQEVMRGIGMAFTVAALSALLVFAGFMMVRLMNAPNPSSTPTALSKPDFQAYYDARVKYVGNNAEVGKLLQVMNIGRFGDYTFTLDTAKEPYGLIINFSDINITRELLDYRKKGRVDEAYYILALVENLSYVEVRFEAYTYRMSVEEANAFIQGNIKEYGESPQKLEELHALLNPAG